MITSRRDFLRTSATAAASIAVPAFVPRSSLGGAGSVAPSDRIVVGGIGIGNRGTYDLSCFLPQADVKFVAVCDIKRKQRAKIKQMVDRHYGNQDCETYRDLRELLDRKDIDAVLIATGPNWHATAAALAARAGKDVYCEKPCTKNVDQALRLVDCFDRAGLIFQAGTQRRNLAHFEAACLLAQSGRLGRLHTMHAHPHGLTAKMSGWLPTEPTPETEDVDWDTYLGPAAWRPFNKAQLDGFNFEKGGGLTGGGVLEWGSHTVDLCQWANDSDGTAPVSYEPPENGQLVATYENGVKLVLRETGWLPLGSCPVRFEGDEGWVETADSGQLIVSSPSLLSGRSVDGESGYPATPHVRDFLDCVKSRRQPRCNAGAACYSHIVCHAANVAIRLNRRVEYDPVRNEFVGDDQANRLRSEAIRAPWRIS